MRDGEHDLASSGTPSQRLHSSPLRILQLSTCSTKRASVTVSAHPLRPNMILPQAPEILLELYNLPFTTGIHASIFYPEHDPSSLPTPTTTSTTRPYVTLTFAQSLDAKIAGAGGRQLILSGKESLIMTHWCVSPLPFSRFARDTRRGRARTRSGGGQNRGELTPIPLRGGRQDAHAPRCDPRRDRHRTQRRPPAQQ